MRDDPRRLDYDLLPDTKARSGAQRLALALTLTQNRSIRSPELTVVGLAPSQRALDAADILRDWTEAERQVLLRRALFDPATYGRVRFHHRSVQEYLAAQQLLILRQSNMPTNALFRLLFAERYGVELVRPSMRPISAWLALWDDAVRTELLRRDPVALLSLGDPQALDIPTRRAIVQAFAVTYGSGTWRGIDLPHDELRRFADPELASTIRESWDTGPTSDDLRELLVKLIWLGPIPDCADLALLAARDHTWRPYDRIVAIRALSSCGDTARLRALASEILRNSPPWPNRVVHGVAATLFPTVLTVDELLTLIRQTPETDHSAGGFGWATQHIATELEPWSDPAVALRDTLAALLRNHAQFQPDRGEISSDYGYLADALATLCNSQLLSPRSRCDAPLISACVVASRCGGRDVGRQDTRNQLRAHFATDLARRGPAFWAELAFLESMLPTADHWDHFYYTTEHTLLGHITEADRPWLEAALADAVRPERRFASLYALLSLWSRRGRVASEIDALQTHLRGDDNLNVILTRQVALHTRHVAREHDERRRPRQRRRDEREQNRVANWLTWRDNVVSDPVRAFSEETRGTTLYNLRKWLDAYAHGSARFNTWSRDALAQAFGDEVAERAEDGFRATWRRVHPLLWSARPEDERNRTPTTWVDGLIGVSAEASVPGWAERLTYEQARLATTYAAVELNGFAPFILDLLEAHPAVVEDVIGNEVTAEVLHVGNRDYLPIVQALAHTESSLKALLAPRLIAELRSWPSIWEPGSEAHFVRHLEQVLDILHSVQSRSDRGAIADECARRYEAQNGSPVGLSWLKGLVRFDGVRGAQMLLNNLEDDNEAGTAARAIEIFGAVFGSRGIALEISDPVRRANLLGRLTLYAYRFVRSMDDVVHEGAFSPGARDEAQDARRVLLNALLETPGPTARDVILDLAGRVEFAEMSDRLRTLAQERTASDAEFECPFHADEVNALFVGLEGPPQGRDDLFSIMIDRLEDLAYDLAHHDFTDRRTVCSITEEREMQRTLALRLHERRNGAYHVTREEEVADQKQPDIRLSIMQGRHRAAIEVKIADKWTLQRRVEGRRVTGRARWLIRRFRTGPQSEAHRHVSSPRSPNPACRFPAPGSPVESCGSHTGFPGATSGRVSRSRGTRLAPLRRSTGWVVRPVDALTTATARAVPFAYACDDVRHCCSSPG